MDGRATCEQKNPKDRFVTADGIRIEINRLPKAGLLVYQHIHEYDHTTLIVTGSVRAWSDGKRLGDFGPSSSVFITAGAVHHFESLEDDTVFYCLHNVLRSDGAIVSHPTTATQSLPCL